MILSATAPLIVAVDQPNSAFSGTIRTPGVERTEAPTRSTRKVTPTTIQP